jgi:hypothetical protein
MEFPADHPINFQGPKVSIQSLKPLKEGIPLQVAFDIDHDIVIQKISMEVLTCNQ